MKSEGRKANQTAFVVGLVVFAIVFALVFMYLDQPSETSMSHGTTIAYHAHVVIDYVENGQPAELPAGIGLDNGIWPTRNLEGEGPEDMAPVHTHNTDNILHIEAIEDKTYTIGDFFEIWGVDPNDYDVCIQMLLTCSPVEDVGKATLHDSDRYRIELK